MRCPYVEGIINSLPFNPAQVKPIKSVKADGKVEIVLTDTDKGLGLVAKTTGRNLKETRWIANYIVKEYF